MSGGWRPNDVAVIIPARNEADHIRATVTAAAGIAGVALVIVVDDGSRDATAEVARR
ncbi:MAG TPA: glycosyltransferase, partial [Streptosporangiaceae bacterium]|nr:glycosyltransferase [Streptosporangiaceae bacterium]